MRKVLCLVLCFALTGCAAMSQPYRAGGLPTLDAAAHPDSIEQDGVTVAVRALAAEEAKEGLVCFLPSYGIQPVMVSVHNGSSRTYRFQKRSISPEPFPALEVYRKVRSHPNMTASAYAPHPWGTSEEEIGWNLMFLLAMPLLLPMLVLGDLSEVSWNSAFKNDLLKKEFKDGPIRPGQTRSGLIFLSREKMSESLRIELEGNPDSEPLVFHFEGRS